MIYILLVGFIIGFSGCSQAHNSNPFITTIIDIPNFEKTSEVKISDEEKSLALKEADINSRGKLSK